MAAPAPAKIPQLRFGAKPGAPKILAPTAEELAEFAPPAEAVPVAAPSGPRAAPAAAAAPPKRPAAEAAAIATTVGAMFKKKGASAAATAAAPPAEEAAPPAEDVDLSKYPADMQEYAIELLGVISDNPYSIKGARPVFPLPTHLGFQKAILKVFSDFIKIPEFGKAPDYDTCKRLGAGAATEVEMYEYQKFVREYVRQATPYRGLLVYHGLGSGKTCSAIAAAEALFSVSRKKIIIMTPASLRDNFIREITFCGFRHFRTQNHWVRLDGTAPIVKIFATEILGLPSDWTKKHPSIWVPDFSEANNFNKLTPDERKEITTQLKAQIENRITFINYNGITPTRLKELACAPPGSDGYGFFDNAVIVVDEIHNLSRLMQGVIDPYLTTLPGIKRKVPLEPVAPGPWKPELCTKVTDPRRPYLTNYKRGYLLYRMLVSARNSKIIGLSGTPLINFPEEIAILINLLGGYIHTSSFTVNPATEANRDRIVKTLNEHPYVDFVEVDMVGVNMNVMFTLLPEGLEKVEGGAQRSTSAQTPSLTQVTEEIIALLKAAGMTVPAAAKYKSEPLLPPIGEEFQNAFLSDGGTKLKNILVLRKRIQGLISYYRGSKKELMPTVTKDEVVRVPMSPYQQSEYQRVRGEELKAQMKKKSKGGEAVIAGATAKSAGIWAQIHELATMKSSNSYRMFSRQACNFAFPEGIARPRPRNGGDALEELGEDNEVLDDGATVDRVAGAGAGAEVILAPAEGEGGEKEAAREDALLEEALVAEARAEGGEVAAAAEKEEAAREEVIIEELAPVAGAPVGAVAAAGAAGAAKTLSAANKAKALREQQIQDCKRTGLLEGEDYAAALRRSKKCLENFANKKLQLFGLGKKIPDEIAAGSPPDPERLAKYSPKFAAILMRILTAPGSSLVYSQFLDMEGIGIFLVTLRCNEFKPILIQPAEGGGYQFAPETLASLKKGPAAGVNRYMVFTGAEKAEVRGQALKVFNARYVEEGGVGKYPDMDPKLAEVLLESGFKGNLHSELCRVFCITAAGAEGLSLRNVRRVHIMDPYWNHVRTDQVKGRAVRICSHVDLEYNADPALNERTVEVYTYCSVFDDQAILHPDGTGGFPRIDQILMGNDAVKPEEAIEMGLASPPGAMQVVVTSDEYLYSLSERKKKLLSAIQDVLKSSAVDCQINQYENEDEGLPCAVLPGTVEQFAFHPELAKDIAETSTKFREGALETPLVAAGAAAADVGAAAAGGPRPLAAPGAAAAAAKATIKARRITVAGTTYLAVPVLRAGQLVPLEYDIYAGGDLYRTKRLGSAAANERGEPTGDIVFA